MTKRVRLKTRSLPVRLSDAELELIDFAADLVGENRSEFLRNAAKARAREIAKASKGRVA